MRHSSLITCGVIVVGSAIMAAQAPPSPAGQSQRMAPVSEVATLTGCLARWDTHSMGPVPHTSGADPQNVFILTNVEPATRPEPPPASGTPEPPSPGEKPPAGMAHNSYMVKAEGAAVNLAQHVEHKVEIAGTLQVMKPQPGPALPQGAAPPPKVMPGGDAKPALPPPTIIAATVKTVAEKCP
ncbi:MAG: hypothetical protein IT178_08350 [Acidobacteria bacterium]|nr:hypothetical protein [Acidobacteriota bacterium]